jgi:hypothetical protein
MCFMNDRPACAHAARTGYEITEFRPLLNPKPCARQEAVTGEETWGRETVLQGSVKAALRERLLAKRSARNVICLSPEGEFMTLQRNEL